MEPEQQKIVSDEGFIDSIRDLGLTTTDAVNELIDNCFDANADTVWITIRKDEDNKLFMIVEDDGDGISPDNIQKALSFGGRFGSTRVTIGKFGWGLSSSICCQSPRTELYSKNKNKDFYYNYVDLEELKRSAGYLPSTIKQDPFAENDNELCSDHSLESGTIIILRNLDRAERKTVDGLLKLLKESLAVVHRKYLASDKSIIINDEKIRFHDPLMLMDDFDGIEECGKGEDYAEIQPITFEDIKDENGASAKIKIKVSKLPVKNIMEKKLQEKSPYNINTDNQGIYIMRHRRQIAGGQTLHLFTRHPQLNYFRAEISFPPCLDMKFGIQTNKSRFSLDDDLRQQLNEKLGKIITQIRSDIKREQEELRAKKSKGSEIERPMSEEIADRALKRLKGSGYRPSKEQKEKEEKELEKEKKEKIKRIKEDEAISKDEKERLIKKIEVAFQRDRTFKRIIDVVGTGEFYIMRHKGNRIEVIINLAHDFYTKIYEKATQDPKLQVLLDLFLFTLAQAEDEYFDNEDVRKFYSTQRREWSSIMSAFLEEAEKELED